MTNWKESELYENKIEIQQGDNRIIMPKSVFKQMARDFGYIPKDEMDYE